MKTSIKRKNPFEQLNKIIYEWSDAANSSKETLLKACSENKLISARSIIQYHNNLLFLLTYSPTKNLKELAEAEMKRLTNFVSTNKELREKLIGSGIFGTSIQSAFSLTLITWLIKEFPRNVLFHSFDETGAHPKEILKDAIPEAEFEIISDEKKDAEQWIKQAAGTKDKANLLEWLIKTLHTLKASNNIKDQLFESLKLYVEIIPTDRQFSKSFCRIPIKNHFYHENGVVKKFNETELINKKLPKESNLTIKEKETIVDASRIALCLLNRETDPITYCNELNIKFYELERGLSIALFSMDKERRLPVESYIGFMMFKNGYPMSYGGAWLFGKRSLIGINIFEAYRGGESAIVFAQLLRCYKNLFKVDYFEVEPYQFGKHNPEGIKSGAFWFYYRFGFRSLNNELFKLAENEHQKIISQKGYRTPYETLKAFTASNLYVNFDSKHHVPINPSKLSSFISLKMVKNFDGDRAKALSYNKETIKQYGIQKAAFPIATNKLGLFISLCFDHSRINKVIKSYLIKMIELKETNEFEYAKLCVKVPFRKILNKDCEA